MNWQKKGFDLTNDRDVLDYIERIVPILRSLGPVEFDIYVRRLSQEFDVSENAISMSVRAGNERRTDAADRRSERKLRDDAAPGKGDGYYERYEMAFALLAMHDPRYIKRFEDDGIKIEGSLSSRIIQAIKAIYNEGAPSAHDIDKDKLIEALDPEEETAFRKAFDNIHTGPDEEAFYGETKKGYLSAKYKDEKAEIKNKIEIAEKLGKDEETSELAGRLMQIDKLISELTEE